MEYQVMPIGDIWSDGVFCMPKKVVSQSLKFADANKIAVLVAVLGNDGKINIDTLAHDLKTDKDEIVEALEFWVQEGVLCDGAQPQEPAEPKSEPKKQLDSLPMPSLTPKDIVAMCRESSELTELLRGAEEILGETISTAMKSNLINMVTYYGLNVPVVLTLLQYYKGERDKGKSFTTRRLQSMAKAWAEEEIDNLDKASQKLQEIDDINDLWNKILGLTELEYRKLNSAQEKMLIRWKNDFSMEMITFATNTMKKYNEKEKQSIKEIDNILKDWKRKGFKTPNEVTSRSDTKSKSSEKLKSSPSFDIDEITKNAMLNDDYDI